MGFEVVQQVIALLIEPAAILHKVEEQETFEEKLCAAVGLRRGQRLVSFQVGFDGFDRVLETLEELACERFFVECRAHIGDGGEAAFAGEEVKALGGGAAGLARAKKIGVATRGRLAADKVAGIVERGFAGGEGEAAIFGVGLVEDGKDAVVFGLINIAGDKLAEAQAVAKQVHAVADGNFKHRKTAFGGKLDFAELDG